MRYNIAANYGAQAYVTLIGILILPFYVRHLGAEAYGLVGFFTLLQNWFNLLDLGLSPTVARETARYRGGALSALNYRRLLRSLQLIFAAIAIVGGAALMFGAGFIAHTWLKVQHLPFADVRTSIQLMALGVSLRWMSGLFRGVVSGSEQFVWLSGFNAIIATLRFPGALLVLIWVSSSPVAFFAYQFLVALVELLGLMTMVRKHLPSLSAGEEIGWSVESLVGAIAPVLKFALSTAFTSAVWVLVTQTDKLILSNRLPLDEYGYYSLGVLVAGGVLMASGPITNSVMPKITKLHAEGEENEITRLYRATTQWVGVVVIPVVVAIALFAHHILFVWTGDAVLSSHAAPILIFYTLGNGLLCLSGLSILLQYAHGNMRLHIIGNVIFGGVFFPSLIWATSQFGVIGACWTWLALNTASFALWLPVVHRTFLPKLHVAWLVRDVGTIVLATLIPAALLSWTVKWQGDRLIDLFIFCAIGMILVVAAAIGSSVMREAVLRYVTPRIRRV
ncbi:lipopolysaccharide biosynthesis protein [Pandoraea morbifera]|uniref:lipopolysaccharide biosynthesis protein n=1 Tax=Pandoraea morbifera TaxID=2508300 RepID=UPI001581B273|nr:oligosaccharide flippase family protein [Pandoraea morbifera]